MIFFLVSSMFSCQSPTVQNRDIAQAIPVQEKTGRHFIITVHGFRGSKRNFGELENVLIPHLKKLHPNIDYSFLQFNYASGSGEDIFDLSYLNLSRFLRENIKNPTLNDSIIFIAHSQGGIVTEVWKAGAQYGLIADQKYADVTNDKIYTAITDQVITLGTPFWGSNQAKLALDLNILKPNFNHELMGLVFNSDLILWMRHLAVSISDRNDDVTQYTNIAGIASNKNDKLYYRNELIRGGLPQILANTSKFLFRGWFKRHSFSSEKIQSNKIDQFESDLTVIIPSTRTSFYYLDKKISCEDEVIDSEEFKQVSLFKPARFILTEALHSAFVTKRTKSLASVPGFCIDPEKCTHPSYRYILNLIANCENQTCDQLAKTNILDKIFEVNRIDNDYNKILTAGIQLQGFTLDLSIQVPIDYELPEKYYRQLPYTDSKTVTVNEDGEEVLTVRRQIKPERDLRFKDKQLVREIVKLDKLKISEDLSDVIDVKIIRRREGMSGLICWGNDTSCSRGHELRLHITGWIKPKSIEAIKKYQSALEEKFKNGLTLPLTIELPPSEKYPFKKISLMSRVRPGFSTFAKLNFLEAENCTTRFGAPKMKQGF